LTSDRIHEPRPYVVLGAGPLGLAVVRHLVARDTACRCSRQTSRPPAGVEVVGADLAVAADAKQACEGAAVVYHRVNPPYAKW
jgi:nucleoside-diphosphate-sugar epimerase